MTVLRLELAPGKATSLWIYNLPTWILITQSLKVHVPPRSSQTHWMPESHVMFQFLLFLFYKTWTNTLIIFMKSDLLVYARI